MAVSEAADDDRLKGEAAGGADPGTAGLLGELLASVTEPLREGERRAGCGLSRDGVLAGGEALSETAGGETGAGTFLAPFVGEVAEVGSLPSCSSSCCCLSPPPPADPLLPLPVAAARAMLDVFCSLSAVVRLLKEAERKPLGVVGPLPDFFFQNANLANASLDAAAEEVEREEEEDEEAEMGEAAEDEG